jgi:hypothetical protein
VEGREACNGRGDDRHSKDWIVNVELKEEGDEEVILR